MPIIINKLGEHRNEDALPYLINYMVMSPYATYCNGRGVLCNSKDNIVREMMIPKYLYDKDDRKQVSHIIIGTNRTDMLIFTELIDIAEAAISYFYQLGFQVFYTIHNGSDNDTSYQHVHLAINTINYITGKRLYESYGIASAFRNMMETQFKDQNWFLKNDLSECWVE